MPQAALFDMDNTLIRVNSARLFTKYRRDRGEIGLDNALRVSWWLLRYWLGNLDAEVVARKALGDYRGTKELDMIAMCEEWFNGYVKQHITQAARAAVRHHQARGDVLVIASSATPYIAAPLARELEIEHLVCSDLAVRDGVLTGDVVDPICYGQGKLRKVQDFLMDRELSLGSATFYSDSITDLPLLDAVGTAVVVNPDARLWLKARDRGWRIEQWKK